MYSNIIGNAFIQQANPTISDTVVKSLLTLGVEALPNEFSALLAGVNNTIITYFPGEKGGHTTRSFRWDGPSLLAAMNSMKKQEVTWLGVFHTHPLTLAVPSQTDASNWHYPSLGYWIMSLSGGEPQLSLYQWRDGSFVPHSFDIVKC